MRWPKLKVCFVAIILVVLSGVAWFTAGPQYAFAAFGFQPFGGRVLTTIPCTCDPGTSLVTVGPPRGGMFIKTPITRLYRYHAVFPPNWVLGMSFGYMVCMEFDGEECVPIGSGPVMRYLGTSLF